MSKGRLILENPVVRVFDEDMANRRLQICPGYGEGTAFTILSG